MNPKPLSAHFARRIRDRKEAKGPRDNSVTVTVRFTYEERLILRKVCEDHEVTMSYLIREAMRDVGII